MSRQEYLAAKYMTGAKADAILARAQASKPKKKKRKLDAPTQAIGGGLSLVVDDPADMSWTGGQDEEEEELPVVEQRKVAFKSHALGGTKRSEAEDEAADEDELPQIAAVITESAPRQGKRAARDDGRALANPAPQAFLGGLQTADQIRAEDERRRREQKEAKAAAKRAKREAEARGEDGGGEETVYRDSSGKKIDTKVMRAEEAKRKRDELEKKMERMEWGKGVVQREDKERKKREEEAMANAPLARYADDEALNDEQRDVARWHDPAAGFLTNTAKKKKTGPSRPTYKGPAPPPNRFGIQPGFRWDGVDRSNGFERQLNQKANERSRRAVEAYSWSAGDM